MNKKEKMKFSKIIVISSISFIVFYTIVQVCLSCFLSVELTPTLTENVYTFFGIELAATALIRIFDKDKKPKKQEIHYEEPEDIIDTAG